MRKKVLQRSQQQQQANFKMIEHKRHQQAAEVAHQYQNVLSESTHLTFMKPPTLNHNHGCKPMNNYEQNLARRISRRRRRANSLFALALISFCCYLMIILSSNELRAQQVASFPGVSRDLASFCSARPSLSIDLATMIVHVKKATSFNYKLYLFSSDNYVFQTGQIVPRDDFRIHSFPVKLKHFNEFLPADVTTFHQTDASSPASVSSAKFNSKAFFARVPIDPEQGKRLPTSSKHQTTTSNRQQQNSRQKRQRDQVNHSASVAHFDVHDDILPGDEPSAEAPFGHHDVALLPDVQLNSNVHFDRDDQVAVLNGRPRKVLERRESPASDERVHNTRPASTSNFDSNQQMILPVGAFSSFHVNTTYLVRKDFDQREVELVRLQIDPFKFQVTQVNLLGGGGSFKTRSSNNSSSSTSSATNATQLDDYAFLSHKLLTDPNTRITSINQIYEDWITRNFYTIVYIQRRLETAEASQGSFPPNDIDESNASQGEQAGGGGEHQETTIVTDRLIFRGSSIVLLGADQLDYEVKASAFITEKNGLHYYFEFLTQGKFYLGAIDWTKRPFTIIDAQRYPLRQTKTKFDNEELLLCPPSVCYSERPIDEVVGYGRLALQAKLMREAAILTRALSTATTSSSSLELNEAGGRNRNEPEIFTMSSSGPPIRLAPTNQTISEHDRELTYAAAAAAVVAGNQTAAQQQAAKATQIAAANRSDHHEVHARDTQALLSKQPIDLINLDELIEAVRATANQLEVRLHLRDWTWTLPRNAQAASVSKATTTSAKLVSARQNNATLALARQATASNATGELSQAASPLTAPAHTTGGSRFVWHYERARRNDIKVTPDTYGFVLTGHEIDASYRVYNELYLISANHLVTINYTLANETVTSAHPLADEFQGLSSTLLDPITGAYYDRYANQLYFFKGDRYVGYDYATKRPLEDFLLPPAVDAALAAGASLMLHQLGGPASEPGRSLAQSMTAQQQALVSSLPVVNILGRQHHVDAVYHDLHDDLVHVFAGAKFYTFQATDFKDGAFRAARQPALRCVNEHFFEGCRFDEAYPNPCHENSAPTSSVDDSNVDGENNDALEHEGGDKSSSGGGSMEKGKQRLSKLTLDLQNELGNFNEEQQMKLRSIAARGGGLLDVLLDNTLVGHGAATRAAIEPLLMRNVAAPNQISTESTTQERIVIYLLISMVLITILVLVAMIFVILSWSRRSHLDGRGVNETSESGGGGGAAGEVETKNSPDLEADEQAGGAQMLTERIAYPPAISQYLANQYHQHLHHQQQLPNPYHQPTAASRRQQVPTVYLGNAPSNHHYQQQQQNRRSGQQPPLPAAPQSQLFQALKKQAGLAQAAQTTGGNGRMATRYNHNTIVDSSAL